MDKTCCEKLTTPSNTHPWDEARAGELRIAAADDEDNFSSSRFGSEIGRGMRERLVLDVRELVPEEPGVVGAEEFFNINR